MNRQISATLTAKLTEITKHIEIKRSWRNCIHKFSTNLGPINRYRQKIIEFGLPSTTVNTKRPSYEATAGKRTSQGDVIDFFEVRAGGVLIDTLYSTLSDQTMFSSR